MLDQDVRAPARLRQFFEMALDLPTGGRECTLRSAGATSTEIEYVRRLLDADRSEMPVFDTAACDWAKHLEDDRSDIDKMIGKRSGAYEIVAYLGKGGSSVVFRAVRSVGDVQQSVALKLLNTGLLSADARRRFRREQKILSAMSHPKIARMIDAGINEWGTPYIAMELVVGVNLITYAESNSLTIPSRLRLFVDLCRAVDAAHRAFIVHRDLKPSNVLVDAEGGVKVLDFGIAKLLDDEDGATETQHISLTPGYAAPEQYARAAVTTSTDVYSLGVIASELLLGARLGPGAMLMQIEKAERALANRRWQKLGSDLAQILRAALAEDPAQRYDSAGHLADDIVRYLNNEPIKVAPPSRVYRMRKFVARNRIAVIAAAALTFAIVCGMAATLWQVARVREQADRANASRDFIVSVFNAAGAELPRDKRPTVEDLVERSSLQLTHSKTLPNALRSDLLLTLVRVARSIGDLDRAGDLLRQADQSIAAAGSSSDATFESQILHAELLTEKAQYEDATKLLQPIQQELLARRDHLSIEALITLAQVLSRTGRIGESVALMRKTVLAATAADRPDELLSTSIFEVSILLDAQRFGEALERGAAVLELWHRQGAPLTQSILELHEAMGVAYEANGDIAAAEMAYKEAIELGDRFFSKPTRIGAWNIGLYGTFLIAQGRFDEAEPFARRGLEMRRAIMGDAHPDTLNAVAGMGKLYLGRRNFPEAANWLTQGIDVCSASNLREQVCRRMLALRGKARAQLQQFEAADQDIAEAMDEQRTATGVSAPAYAYILDQRVVIDLAEQKWSDALTAADNVLSINSAAKGAMLEAELMTRFHRAIALLELHRSETALSEMLDIEPRYAKLFPSGDSRFEMLALLARAYEETGKTQEASLAAKAALEHQHPNIDTSLVALMQSFVGAKVTKRSCAEIAQTMPSRPACGSGKPTAFDQNPRTHRARFV